MMDNSTTFQGNGEVAYIPVVVNGKQSRQTNGDNFRAMTDEELARTLFDVSWAAWRNSSNGEGIWTEQDWLDWLKQECES